jgi:hypothetical protein
VPVATAAVRAAHTAGTELGDKRGLWVELRRRTRLRSDPEAPAVDEDAGDEDADEAVSDA